jgi:hypothetical protein
MQVPTARAVAPMFAVTIIALVVGFAVGRGWSLVDATMAKQNQATPTVECLPSSESSPMALASPIAVGRPVTYVDDWTVTVTGATKLQSSDVYVPEGVLVAVSLIVTNDTATGRFFPFEELTLLDSEGRPYVADGFFTNAYPNSKGVHHTFNPSLPIDTAVVFDVREDAGDTFILQSTADPSFRVQVDLALRGESEIQTAS